MSAVERQGEEGLRTVLDDGCCNLVPGEAPPQEERELEASGICRGARRCKRMDTRRRKTVGGVWVRVCPEHEACLGRVEAGWIKPRL